ncbi:hypothetical protein GCK72_025660 [Caenorhabditis remanei]|uniref:ShKT domain-containing protein n=1 Tax=Caenorhabditis remanei TaxID=31234 RepID=A0A6A5G321_CAERE|nr:hypothetical protein GCK72_025660 [Caenorhabditis remanei]KAF1749193.1 hypothetical protein GCK72_025660 [Caenorhabditis remanei]
MSVVFQLLIVSTLVHGVLSSQRRRAVPTVIPSIYEFIANNAYICSPVQLPDGSLVTFLSEEKGAKCEECNHASLGFGNACGVRIMGSVTEEVSCFEVPPLCIEAFELRYMAQKRLPSTRKPRKRLSFVNSKEERELSKSARFEPTTIPTTIGMTTTTTTPSTTIVTFPPASSPSTTNPPHPTLIDDDDFTVTPVAVRQFKPKKSRFALAESMVSVTKEIATGTFKISRVNDQKNNDMIRIVKRKLNFIGTTTTTPAPKPTPKLCEDKHGLCCFWATTGECTKNPFWMKVNCPKTCGTCDCELGNADKCVSTGINCTLPTTTILITTTTTTPKPTTTTTTLPTTTTTRKKYTRPYTPPASGFRRTQSTTTNKANRIYTTTTPTTTTTEATTTTVATTTTADKCKDYHKECSFWAMLNECHTNPFYMRPNCQKSCNSCGELVGTVYAPTPRPGCDNGHQLCNYWAHIGECSSNANYMLPNCRLACRVC